MRAGAFFLRFALAGAVLGVLGWCVATAAAQGVMGAGPADPPPGDNRPHQEISGPSVVQGEHAGIEVGQHVPDFQLEPIKPYSILGKWLGTEVPQRLDQPILLSQLVGKVPVMLLFGSYT